MGFKVSMVEDVKDLVREFEVDSTVRALKIIEDALKLAGAESGQVTTGSVVLTWEELVRDEDGQPVLREGWRENPDAHPYVTRTVTAQLG